MARAQNSDYMQNFRFHVKTYETKMAVDPILFEGDPGGEAGFQAVTLPDMSVEATEYREGTSTYTKKFPGPPTVTDVTMMRGLAQRDSAFWDWCRAAAEGGEYRADLVIYHFHRSEVADDGQRTGETAARYYIIHEALPIRAKPGADFDATSGEVSLAEVDASCEWIEVVKPEA